MNDATELGLTADHRKVLAALLAEQRQHANEQIESLSRSFDDIIAAVEMVNNDDEHDPEGTTIAFERAQVLALLDQAKADLAAVEAATSRLADGTYGVCEVCHGAVGVERLMAIPSASRCVACA